MLEQAKLNPPPNMPKRFDWGLAGSWFGGLVAVVAISGGIYWCVDSSTKEKSEVKQKEAIEKVEKDKKSQETQTKFFIDAQKYVDLYYPKWKVRGFRLDEALIGELEEPKLIYNLLLTDGQNERVVLVVEANFTLADGTTESKLYEPSKAMIKRVREKSVENKAEERGKQKEKDEQEALEERYEPEPPEPF